MSGLASLPTSLPPSASGVTLSAGTFTDSMRTVWARFRTRKLAYYSFHFLILLYLVAVFAEFLAPYDALRYDLDHPYCPPQLLNFSFSRGLYVHPLELHINPVTFRRIYVERADVAVPVSFFAQSEPYHLCGIIPLQHKFLGVSTSNAPGTFYLLGTDKYGRDILSRTIHGARISLSVGLLGVVITCLLGMTIGGISGYVGGRTDNLIQRGIEIINSFPHVPLWIAVAATLPRDWSPLRIYFAVTLVLSLLTWTSLARVVRGKILVLREEDYATAARLLGASHTRILFRHLLPGFTSHIIVSLTFAIPAMILGETALSFLGLGLRPPIVSWGVMIQDCLDVQAIRYYPWLLVPVVFIVLAVLGFNYVGDALRDAADPYAAQK